ncbi:MAG TPA: helicase-related protein [Methanocorpusculum sp.]|nr:helicase-related protein [Methanocorpusculum sp.]HJK02005.1 helicase-related protein [Methanocorpusculum sp.]
MKNHCEYVSNITRRNLQYEVHEESSSFIRVQRILSYVVVHPNVSGIIYCFSRKSCEYVSERLRRSCILASPYHAGMSSLGRSRIQEGFLKNSIQIICEKTAFGVEIDKSNVEYVIHTHLPKDFESYYQETGRAARDGDCVDYISIIPLVIEQISLLC